MDKHISLSPNIFGDAQTEFYSVGCLFSFLASSKLRLPAVFATQMLPSELGTMKCYLKL